MFLSSSKDNNYQIPGLDQLSNANIFVEDQLIEETNTALKTSYISSLIFGYQEPV
jgi:hypothetical protein